MNFPFYVGQGFDIHRLMIGYQLKIGGVNIPYSHGLIGHSDADVLIHAIIDALLGASRLGDIGRNFPDDSIEYKDIDSRVILRKTADKIDFKRLRIINLDTTIHAQSPKMAPYVDSMISNISEDLRVDPKFINIKAKSNENLGHIGRGEGISANAIVLLADKDFIFIR
ncbi:2-C-methyl-D-erythritol 2,4-cyclodiphosphate synthase [Candidatus Kinetoplastibacterium blastocrithidii TCC012E]|uniref:2-C-methyl-D-erythritol 2,4-cyclodiphosphate synthase n=1 Tax=Candidatus Kinetoplastidibacterium blastocrithidiae TCC012E TaxID=1208922 RepID=M1M0W1_9PROT|nr:2-C-methyl-D-erythritol 2,4-cyclodiphosphate synthase [Candidatus Kinetoplastibacterium blastocrithidii]AFZ83791.1 2-C-methyl-D-erythritol 2,4-cyclodiphosphate synthase [Candidatus Kinetoplastibacterium blastocrithidii (ex Strigomonas culicis)]AGF49916.1 2-C-methyl-D-erythritol 2,4-cyclodiphosphate synthase [Candidatus Kinetoplastibacterium blastocrithidii TCC012E]